MKSDDELALIKEAQHNPQAFGAIYDQNVDRVYAYALRLVRDEALAQDITAVTFEKALAHIRSYKGQGKSICAWLYRIARNEAMSHFRKQKRLLPWQAVESHAEWHSHPRAVETAVSQSQRHQQLHDTLAQLSAKDCEIITLRYFESLTSEEVADILGCSTNSVYVRLHRALGKLQHLLESVEPQREASYVS